MPASKRLNSGVVYLDWLAYCEPAIWQQAVAKLASNPWEGVDAGMHNVSGRSPTVKMIEFCLLKLQEGSCE